MRGILILLMIMGTTVRVSAQEKSSFSLEDCINYALSNNEQLKIKQLDREVAEAEIRKTISVGLPQASLEGNLNYNYEVQQALIPSFTDPSKDTTFAFTQKYDGKVDLTIDQLIFDAAYLVGLQATKIYRELSTKEHIKLQIDVVEAVSKAYYNILIAEKRLELVEKNMSRLDTLLRETAQMYEVGFAEKVDVDRIRVNYNNLRVEHSKSKELKDISRKLLNFQMGMDLNRSIELTTEDFEDVDIVVPAISTENFDYNQRIEFSQLETNKNLTFLDMKNNQAQYFPKITAQFGYGWNTAAMRSSQLFESNRWLDNGVVGLTASLPIFDGFLKNNKIQQNKLQIKQIENQMSFMKKSIDLEIEQSRISLNSQLEMLKVQKQNMELAQEVYNISKIKYQEGVGSNIEIINADTSLKEAQTNYLNSLYQAITSKIELKKALGIFYNN